jgi:hypothetical protein
VGWNDNDDDYAVADQWSDGRWTVDDISAPAGGSGLLLDSVSCIGSSFCVAVGGYSTHGGDNASAAAIWNGTTWRLVSTASGGFGTVACSSSSDCLAVGGTVAEHFNGSSWSSVSIRRPRGAPAVYLEDVAVVQGSYFLVVGSTSSGPFSGKELVYVGFAVVEEYNGRWLRVLQD